jgi:superfamily I DNA/RNA helicase
MNESRTWISDPPTILDRYQQMAVTACGATLVLAGPGAGKTKTLVEKIAYESGRGRRVIAITFTTSAAALIAERLSGQRGFDPEAIEHIGTLHSYCLRLIRRGGMEREIADESMMETLIEEARERLRLKSSLSMKRAAMVWRGRNPETRDEKLFLRQVERALEEASLIDYDGILRAALPYMAGKIWHDTTLVVDEVQDSAAADLDIYEAAIDAGAQFWAVGDLQQSIFGFRHPEPVDIWSWWSWLMSEAGAPEEQRAGCTLPLNYRSQAAVVSCCNVINVGFAGRISSKALAGKSGGAVNLVRKKTESGMLDAIASQVAQSPTPRQEIAVLVRTWKEAEKVAQALSEHGVMYRSRKESKRAVAGIPALLWAAAAMWQRPNDWRCGRYAALRWGAESADKLRAKARAEQVPLIGFVLPGTLWVVQSQPQAFCAALAALGVSREDEGWMLERLRGEIPDNWEDFSLKLFEAPEVEEEGSGVTVTTVHSAKGREWAEVLVGYCDDYSYRCKGEIHEVAEQDRVLFVAASRAAEQLTFFYCDVRAAAFGPGVQAVAPARALARLIAGAGKA